MQIAAEHTARREAGGVLQVAIELDIEDPWHIYHDDLGPDDAIGDPTEVTFGGADVEWSEVLFPEPHVFDQEFGLNGEPTTANGHEGFLTLYASGVPNGSVDPAAITADLAGQICTEETCVKFALALASEGAGSDSIWTSFPADVFGGAASNAGTSTDAGGGGGTSGGSDSNESLWAFLGLAVFWGLFTLLMPCTYPMIPITISFFTKQATDQNPSKQILTAVARPTASASWPSSS